MTETFTALGPQSATTTETTIGLTVPITLDQAARVILLEVAPFEVATLDYQRVMQILNGWAVAKINERPTPDVAPIKARVRELLAQVTGEQPPSMLDAYPLTYADADTGEGAG